MISGFWSPLQGRGHSADAAVCTGLLQGIDGDGKTLVAGCDGRYRDVDSLLAAGYRDGSGDMGMEALARLAKNNRLPAETVPHYTVGILKEERLDYLPVVKEGDGNYSDWHGKAYRTASRHYEQIYLLLEGGLEKESRSNLLGLVDHLFICVEQDVHMLAKLKEMEEELEKQCQAEKTVLINPCHLASKWSPSHIRRKYGFKRVMAIPFNVGYMDAANQGLTADFLYRQSSCRSDDANRPWVDACQAINRFIVKEDRRLLRKGVKVI